MPNSLLIALLASCSLSAAQAQVYKCVEDGKTIFQGVPCRGAGAAIIVDPASGPATATAPTVTPDSVTRMKDDLKSMETSKRQREIDSATRDTYVAIQNLERVIQSDQSSMANEMAMVRSQKLYANNNLAGATWEQSISTEMQAIAAKYRTIIQINRDRVTQLRADFVDLQRRKSAKE